MSGAILTAPGASPLFRLADAAFSRALALLSPRTGPLPFRQPYRGSGANRPPGVPLPPGPMPLVRAGRLLKRWRYVSVWSPTISLCAARVQAGPAQQEFWAVWDRAGQRLAEHTRLVPGRVHLPAGGIRVRDGATHIDVTLDETGQGLEVLTPLGRAYTWTRKQIVRAHGTARLGGVTLPIEAVALIDDNAGYHPRHTRWQWSGGAGTTEDGRAVAWNAIVGLNSAPSNSERTVWVDGVPQEIGPVRFAPDLASVTFAEGGALHFTPEATRQRHENLLLIRSAYRQPFGSFTGTLPGGLVLREGHGVMEWHDAVW